MLDRPERYRWSSYPGYHCADRTLSWMTEVVGDTMGEDRTTESFDNS